MKADCYSLSDVSHSPLVFSWGVCMPCLLSHCIGFWYRRTANQAYRLSGGAERDRTARPLSTTCALRINKRHTPDNRRRFIIHEINTAASLV